MWTMFAQRTKTGDQIFRGKNCKGLAIFKSCVRKNVKNLKLSKAKGQQLILRI